MVGNVGDCIKMSSTHNSVISSDHNGLVPVAWALLVMGLSLTGVILIYLWIGHIGPTYSSDVMNLQQSRLRHMYGLPPQPIVTDKRILQIPPSLRNVPNITYYSTK
ncbi:MAG TPA: hypothetical protein VH500_05860 [Nitrososphaeraceae archaeon]|jgi:hypothetical protein